eukprot:jgi/Chrzof1/5688/Cz16g11220.t1
MDAYNDEKRYPAGPPAGFDQDPVSHQPGAFDQATYIAGAMPPPQQHYSPATTNAYSQPRDKQLSWRLRDIRWGQVLCQQVDHCMYCVQQYAKVQLFHAVSELSCAAAWHAHPCTHPNRPSFDNFATPLQRPLFCKSHITSRVCSSQLTAAA